MAGQWLGPVENTFEVLDEHHTGGVIVVAGAIPAQQLSGVVRGLQERNIHIQLSSGLRGIDFRRLRANPIAYEPLFYVEPWALPHRQLVIKRALDIMASGFALLCAAPVMLAWISSRSRTAARCSSSRCASGARQALHRLQVPHDGRRRRGSPEGARGGQRAPGTLFKMTRDPASPGSASSSGTPASTSSRSSSTWSRAR
jgi:hypothetical protein